MDIMAIRKSDSFKKGSAMYIIHVHVHVKPEQVEAFKKASIENASNSLQEPGVARFDVIQQTDDLTHFILVEVYRTPADPAKHKETAHYNQWREIAEPMMAEPRTRVIFNNIYPADEDW
jgi:(4S)-4-hydroxy-5-phosphonooxypentane-2,3-dione isomerase